MNTSLRMRRASSLPDLVVSGSLLGLLLAALAPALQNSNEVARQAQCINQLKQIGLGIQNFHDIRQEVCPSYLTTDLQTHAPTGHATWAVLLMPYMERHVTYDLFTLTDAVSSDVVGPTTVNHAEGRTASLSVYLCPSRRIVPDLTKDKAGATGDYGNVSFGLLQPERMVLGYTIPAIDPEKPRTHNGSMMMSRAYNGSPKPYPTVINNVALGPGDFRSMTNFASIIDGLSNTAFIGEKAVHQERVGNPGTDGKHQDGPLYFGKGAIGKGREALISPGPLAFWSRRLGAENAETPTISAHPKTDDPNNRFGSWHPAVTMFAMGDGSVQAISNKASNEVLGRLGARNDRMTFDLPKLSAEERQRAIEEEAKKP